MPLEISDTFFMAVKWLFGQPTLEMTNFIFFFPILRYSYCPCNKHDDFPSKRQLRCGKERQALAMFGLKDKVHIPKLSPQQRAVYTDFRIIPHSLSSFCHSSRQACHCDGNRDAEELHGSVCHMHWITRVVLESANMQGKERGTSVHTPDNMPYGREQQFFWDQNFQRYILDHAWSTYVSRKYTSSP